MERFAREGGTIILVTHEMEEIAMCHRVYLLQDGQLADYDTVDRDSRK